MPLNKLWCELVQECSRSWSSRYGIGLAEFIGMATFTSTMPGARQADWLHWLYFRGDRAISLGVDVRGDRIYVLTLLPLWSPEGQITETFSRPAHALRRHAEIAQQLQDEGWLLVEGRPVTTAA
jgi:hypothetical protein